MPGVKPSFRNDPLMIRVGRRIYWREFLWFERLPQSPDRVRVSLGGQEIETSPKEARAILRLYATRPIKALKRHFSALACLQVTASEIRVWAEAKAEVCSGPRRPQLLRLLEERPFDELVKALYFRALL